MRTALRVILSFLGGLIVVYLVTVSGVLWYAHVNHIVDRDGGMSMATIFVIGPFAGIVGGIATAIAIPLWLARRERPPAMPVAPPPKSHRLPPKTRAIIAAAGWGIATYAVAWGVLWLFTGMSFKTYEAARAAGLMPWGCGLTAAALAAFLVLRKPRT